MIFDKILLSVFLNTIALIYPMSQNSEGNGTRRSLLTKDGLFTFVKFYIVKNFS